jgi:hypothetical protein
VPWQKAPGDHATLTAAARALARDVGEREAAEQQKLLADTGESQPADVGYAQPDLQFWRTDGGAQHGSLGTINTFYAGLHHGWLVILGEAGAGKTVRRHYPRWPSGAPHSVPTRIVILTS